MTDGMALGSIAWRGFSCFAFSETRKSRTSSALFTSTSSRACSSLSAWIFASSWLSRTPSDSVRAMSRTATSPMRMPASASTRSVRGSKFAGNPVSSTRDWPDATCAERSIVALPGYRTTFVMRPLSCAKADVANNAIATAR
jgi:hypothetical protein